MRQSKLETIVWLARLGSFTATAERLHTTQAAISQRVAAIERELGVVLFERTSRTLKMTPKGLELLPYAEKIVDLSAEMMAKVAEKGAYHGTIRLGAVETIVHVWLPRLIEHVRRECPNVVIELLVDTSVVLRDGVAKGILDMAFLLEPVNDPGLIKIPLCTYPLAWVASPALGLLGKRISLGELATLPIITFSRQSLPYALIKDMFRGLDIPPVRLNASASLTTTIRLTVNGMGVSMLPPIAIKSELADGRLHIFETDSVPPALTYIAIYPATPLNPIAEVIARMAQDSALAGPIPAPPAGVETVDDQ